jgi:periplasmic divalent cation tolerance protein
MSSEHVVVTFTTDSKELADSMCAEVIGAELGACAQIEGPITSVFRWHGEVHTEQEWRVEIETTHEKVEALVDHIKANHGVDIPEVRVNDLDTDIMAEQPQA